MSVLTVEHDGYTFVQGKYYIPIIGGYGFVILDEMMQIKKQGATKHRLTPIEAEWMISNLRMERVL